MGQDHNKARWDRNENLLAALKEIYPAEWDWKIHGGGLSFSHVDFADCENRISTTFEGAEQFLIAAREQSRLRYEHDTDIVNTYFIGRVTVR